MVVKGEVLLQKDGEVNSPVPHCFSIDARQCSLSATAEKSRAAFSKSDAGLLWQHKDVNAMPSLAPDNNCRQSRNLFFFQPNRLTVGNGTKNFHRILFLVPVRSRADIKAEQTAQKMIDTPVERVRQTVRGEKNVTHPSPGEIDSSVAAELEVKTQR